MTIGCLGDKVDTHRGRNVQNKSINNSVLKYAAYAVSAVGSQQTVPLPLVIASRLGGWLCPTIHDEELTLSVHVCLHVCVYVCVCGLGAQSGEVRGSDVYLICNWESAFENAKILFSVCGWMNLWM